MNPYRSGSDKETPQARSPHEIVRLLPRSALGGALCGVACEVCPLRAWKSRNITALWCRDILKQHRRRIDCGQWAVSIT